MDSDSKVEALFMHLFDAPASDNEAERVMNKTCQICGQVFENVIKHVAEY